MTDSAASDTFRTDYISEDAVSTFEGWLNYQQIDTSTLTAEETAGVRELFDDAVKRRAATKKVGRMKLKPRAGELKYAVAIREGADLWLALWLKRTARPEYFIMHPTADGNWNPHSSLHADGTFHLKSHDKVMIKQQKQRPASITGTEHLGGSMGFAPKTIGAVCDLGDFTGVFEAPAGVLGPRNGHVTVDLIEPGSGAQPLAHPAEEIARHLFTDAPTHVLIRVFRS